MGEHNDLDNTDGKGQQDLAITVPAESIFTLTSLEWYSHFPEKYFL